MHTVSTCASMFFIYFDLSCHKSAPWVFVRCPSCWWEVFQMNLLHESSTGQTEWSWKLRKPCCVADWPLFQGDADDCTIFLLAEPFYGGSGFCNHRHLSLAETFFRRCGCLWYHSCKQVNSLFAAWIFRWLSMLWRSWHGQWHYQSIASCSLVAIEATFEPWTLFLRNSGCDAFGDFEQSQKYRWQLLLPWSFRGMSHRLRSNDAPAYLGVLQEGRFFPDSSIMQRHCCLASV